MNKNVWLWWEQGWNQAPEICKMTVKSFEKSSPDWKIHCLSKDNLWEYISKDYKWIMSCQGPAFRGDLVRAILLKEYGGVYSDAACMSMKNLNNVLNLIEFDDFFTFKLNHFYKTDRETVSWFILAEKNSKVMSEWSDLFLKKAKANPINHPYFLMHYCFNELVQNNTMVKNHFTKMKSIAGFQNRIDQTLLHLTIEEAEKKAKAKHHSDFHPNNLQEKISANEFIHLKLRHHGLSSNLFSKEDSLYNILFSNIK